MPQPNFKHLVALTIVIFLALALLFSLILRNSFDFRGLSMKEMHGRRPAYDKNGVALENEAAFILMRPLEAARTPRATRFDMPLGSEHGALTYNFQPFMAFNEERKEKHLGDDLNGIGGMDTDLGDPVYAIAAGRVVYSGDVKHGWGNVIIIAHRRADGTRLQSFYAHCERRDTSAGVNVRRGEQIGTVGKGGGEYPAHLHFEVRNSLCANPGRGYFTTALNRLDPTATILNHRGAPDDLLNPAPQPEIILPEIHMIAPGALEK